LPHDPQLALSNNVVQTPEHFVLPPAHPAQAEELDEPCGLVVPPGHVVAPGVLVPLITPPRQ
jgi:hypothetical protein